MDGFFAMFVSEFVLTSVNFHRGVDLKSDKKVFFHSTCRCVWKYAYMYDPIFDPSFLHAGIRVCALIPGLTIGGQRRQGWKLWSTIYSTAMMTTGWESKQLLKLIQILKGDGLKRLFFFI